MQVHLIHPVLEATEGPEKKMEDGSAELGAMNIASDSENGITVLTLSGRLDALARYALQSAVKEAESLNPQQIVIKMEGVTFMNSAGVGLIKNTMKQSKIAKWKVTLKKSHVSLWGFDLT